MCLPPNVTPQAGHGNRNACDKRPTWLVANVPPPVQTDSRIWYNFAFVHLSLRLLSNPNLLHTQALLGLAVSGTNGSIVVPIQSSACTSCQGVCLRGLATPGELQAAVAAPYQRLTWLTRRALPVSS